MKTLPRIAVFLSCLLIAGASHADISAFLVLQDGGNFTDRVRAIEATGTRVRQAAPPRVLMVELPKGAKPGSLPGVQNFYTSVVPIADLASQGPTAVAAGLQWNRRMLSTARSAGTGSFGSMRQLVADRSMPAPTNLRVSPATGRLVCEWDGVDGAGFYELQASGSSLFNTADVRTSVVKTRVEISAPETEEIYVRVRAVDPADAGADDDVVGRWSSAARLGAVAALPTNGAPPTLTSPANRLETEGFTLILEWTPSAGPARVQVSRDAAFAVTVFDEIATSGEYACPGPALRTGDRLFWRVQTLDGARSAWSSSREVSIGAPRPSHIDAFVNPEAPR